MIKAIRKTITALTYLIGTYIFISLYWTNNDNWSGKIYSIMFAFVIASIIIYIFLRILSFILKLKPVDAWLTKQYDKALKIDVRNNQP